VGVFGCVCVEEKSGGDDLRARGNRNML
jgi:hypothetical protein